MGALKTVPQLYDPETRLREEKFIFRNLTLQLHESGLDKWWEVLENCSDPFYANVLGNLPYANCISNTVLYTFSDKLFPEGLSWLTAGGYVLSNSLPKTDDLTNFSLFPQRHWYLFYLRILGLEILPWPVFRW